MTWSARRAMPLPMAGKRSSTTAAPTCSRPGRSASGWRCGPFPTILAFDCFRELPHYHYGPRNKNHRIYWDKTVVPDPLEWTLDLFKARKLGAMIEAAGYPGVAADLDEELVASLLPDLEARAREMQPKQAD